MTQITKVEPSKPNQTVRNSTRIMHIIPRKVARSLLIVVGILLGAYLLSGVLNKILGVDSVLTQAFYAAFDMDGEDNVPAAFSFLILIIAAALLIVVGITTRIKGHRKFWIGLSMIFFFLGCDEFMQIHEHLGMYMKAHTTASVGGSNFVWVLPYGIFALVVGALLLRFVLLLPKNTRTLFFIAGFLYVFSALVIDYTQGIIQKQELPKIYYKLLTCIEEPGEMVAIIIFIYALLDYLAPPQGNIKIEVAEKLA